MSQRFEYFRQLAAAYYSFLQQVGDRWSSQSQLQAALDDYREEAIATLQSLHRPDPPPQTPPEFVGLNTVGLLSDRLSILTIKEWCLRNQNQDEEKAQRLYKTQTLDIIATLAQAPRAKSALNSKLTRHQADIHVPTWEAAIYELLAANITIWKAQEALYCHDLESRGDRFKHYVRWFPQVNVRRDALIQACETLYWLDTSSPLP
ncbi:MAG: hypothetical protein RIB93_33165 [Coleofasciculus sp. D1-CHI-01]|uniref:hypothetical protein n=1 Tax=Coleofasciculus sp. D1-CHI-01 TaxID=3068482 RepID=UPI003302B44A